MSPYDPYQNTFQEGQQPYGPTVQHFQDQQQPLPPEPFTQSDLMRLYQLNNALSTAQKEVDDGVLTQEQGLELTKGILGMRAPLIQRQGQAMEWAKKQQLNQVQEANALVQGMQQSDAIYRSRGFSDRVTTYTDPLSGQTAHFYEQEPNKWTQVEFGQSATEQGVQDYFPQEPSAVGGTETDQAPQDTFEQQLAEARFAREGGPQGLVRGAYGNPAPETVVKGGPSGVEAGGTTTPERQRKEQVQQADDEMMNWLRGLPDKTSPAATPSAPTRPAHPGYTAMGPDGRPLDPIEDPRYAGQFEHPLFGQAMSQWRDQYLAWRDQAYPQKQQQQQGVGEGMVIPDHVAQFFRNKAAQQNPWRPPFTPQDERQNAILWRMYEDHQRKVGDMADYYSRNWLMSQRSLTGIQEREESSRRLMEERKEMQKELKVRKDNYQKRLEHHVDELKKDEAWARKPHKERVEEARRMMADEGYADPTEQGNQSRMSEEKAKQAEALFVKAEGAAGKPEGAAYFDALQTLYGKSENMPPELRKRAVALQARLIQGSGKVQPTQDVKPAEGGRATPMFAPNVKPGDEPGTELMLKRLQAEQPGLWSYLWEYFGGKK